MTPEQFVCWLQGFLKGMKFSDQKLPIRDIVEEEVQKVVLNEKTNG